MGSRYVPHIGIQSKSIHPAPNERTKVHTNNKIDNHKNDGKIANFPPPNPNF